MGDLEQTLIGDWHLAYHAGIKAIALFLTAAFVFRFQERRTLAQFAPYDWVAAVAVGAIVGRTATATDASWFTGAVALIALLLSHSALTRMRFVPALRRIIDPPLLVLIHDGVINRRSLHRCGMTMTDLESVLRQHGQVEVSNVHLALIEARGTVTVVPQS